MIYGLGTDIVEIPRVKKVLEKHGDMFLERILSADELPMLEKYTNPDKKVTFIAGRWAAKEAFSKALKTGIGDKCVFTEISILPTESGAPEIKCLYGVTQNTVKSAGIAAMHVSISHERDYAVATVIFEK